MGIPEIQEFKAELEDELHRILLWWERITPDEAEGGFYGQVDHKNKVIPGAVKGSVLNSRILWAFSAAYNYTRQERYKVLAQRAYEYFVKHFTDDIHGGVYWTVDHAGKPLDTKKQTYAIAFAVYGLSEYYICSNDESAKEKAVALYEDIITHTTDKVYGGYFEAFSQDWQLLSDLRLSTKDANEKKSMNTHLHVVEAFVNLYRVWPDEKLKWHIKELLRLFEDHIIDKDDHHLLLFFTESWEPRSSMISYGHDIEAAWLLLESAEVVADAMLIERFKKLSIDMAVAAAEGLDEDGGLWYEYEPAEDHLVKEKHWWPQAEAMVGFFNAWQLTENDHFLQNTFNNWHFIKEKIMDVDAGEWVWGIKEDNSIMTQETKAGIWKCPYHNSRACIEILQRIQKTKNNRYFYQVK